MALLKPRSNYLKQYEPRAKMPCLCGSGQKFKKCCAAEYDTPAKFKEFEAYKSGQFGEALKKCRLNITWYILCHKAHTVPFLESETEASKELFQIDIEALASLVDLLLSCYEQTGKHKKFPQALDALQNAITDARWYDRIAYFRALWCLFDNADDSMIYHELKKISDLENTKDVDVLTLYLQVCPEKSFSESIEIIDRILSASPSRGISLQYQTLKGVQYFLLKDNDTAKSIIDTAVAKFKAEGLDNASFYELGMLAQSLHVLGQITDNKSYVAESQIHFKKMLEFQGIKPAGTAMIYSNLGHSFLFDGKPAEAKDYFIKSLEIDSTEITKVFLGKSWLHLQEFDNAEKTLSQINTSNMDEREKYDFSVAWAILALETKKTDLLIKAKTLLNEVKPEGPLFKDIKDALLSDMQRVINGDYSGKILKFISRYLHLQPNFFGLGVNINNILEDAGRKGGGKKDR